MKREDMINELVERDINSIRDSLAIDDESFLDAVLRGDGWIPYNQLTDEQLQQEYEEFFHPHVLMKEWSFKTIEEHDCHPDAIECCGDCLELNGYDVLGDEE